MKKLFIIFILLLNSFVLAQKYDFAVITDIHIGARNSETDLDSVVARINSMDNLKFVIASGDIAEKGRNSELEKAKEILDRLKIPYYIIPGNHDTKWSESGCTKFRELWNDDKFSFSIQGDHFIGLNSGIPWRGGGGHFSNEDIYWLSEELANIDTKEPLFFIVHHPLNESIDNWYKVYNLLIKNNIKAVFVGHGHSNKIFDFNGIPGIMSRSTLSSEKESWGFNIIKRERDTLSIFSANGKDKLKYFDKIILANNEAYKEIDSSDFVNYDTEILHKIDLKSTLSAIPYIYKGKIFTAAQDGIVSCFDTTGSLLWDYDAFGNIMSKPALADGIIAVGTAQGDLQTLNARNGRQIQTIGFDEAITSQLVIINYTGDKKLMIPKKTKSNSAVVAGTASGKLYCFDLETLEQIWVNSNAEGMIETEPLIIGNNIFYGSWDGNLYCIDSRSGLLIWKWKETKNFYFSPAACKLVSDGKSLYLTTPDKIVYSIDANTGNVNWSKDVYDAWESVGLSNDGKYVFVKSMKDKFYILNAKTGTRYKKINIDYGLDTMPCVPIENNGFIFFGSKNGNVYRINSKYYYKTLFYMGQARIHTVQPLSGDTYLASNMDGSLVIFKYNDE